MVRCCENTAGQLKHRVFLEKRTRTPDGAGGSITTWAADPASGVRCKMQFLTGTERWEHMRNKPGNLIRLTMRFKDDGEGNAYWQPGTHRVRYQGRYFDILAVSTVDWEKRWIKMDIFEGAPS